MWLPVEIEAIVVHGLEQFEPDPAGEVAVQASPEAEAQWIIWSEAMNEADWANFELSFLAVG